VVGEEVFLTHGAFFIPMAVELWALLVFLDANLREHDGFIHESDGSIRDLFWVC